MSEIQRQQAEKLSRTKRDSGSTSDEATVSLSSKSIDSNVAVKKIKSEPVIEDETETEMDHNEVSDEDDIENRASHDTMDTHLKRMVNNPELSDVSFKLDSSVIIYGHKFILSMRSSFFRNLFKGTSNNMIISISNLDAKIFQSFIQYLYTDELNKKLDDNELVELLSTGYKYDVPSLIQNIGEEIICRLSVDNCLIFYESLHSRDSNLTAFDKIEKYIELNTNVVLNNNSIHYLTKESLLYLLGSDELSIDELNLFHVILSWATYQCSQNGMEPTSTNQRLCLGPLLYLIRFHTMSSDKFSNEICNMGILTDKEIVTIFRTSVGNSPMFDRKSTSSSSEFPLEFTADFLRRPKRKRQDCSIARLPLATSSFKESRDTYIYVNIPLKIKVLNYGDILKKCSAYSTTIMFRLDQPAKLDGLRTLPVLTSRQYNKYNIHIIIFSETDTVEKIILNVNKERNDLKQTGDEEYRQRSFPCILSKPVDIIPNHTYMIRIKIHNLWMEDRIVYGSKKSSASDWKQISTVGSRNDKNVKVEIVSCSSFDIISQLIFTK